MAQIATSGQKATVRKEGQWSDLYAAIFFPHTIYTARLDTLPTTTDMIAQIAFTSGSGTLADVLPDMTLWVGTSAGAYDLGMCRIRKTPIAGTFYIGEQSKVDWQASCYLTVVDDFDLKAKHIHIDGTTPKMDYDIAYSDQHETFKPVPVLGPIVRVAKLEGASVDVQLGPESGYSSYVFDSTITSFAWSCATATFDDDTSETPIASLETVGWHVFYCLVTADNGETKTGVRYVYIWDDDNLPHEIVESPTFDESYDGNGINFSIALANNAALSSIPDRALCVLFSVDHYGDYLNDEIDTLGPISGAENIEGVGRIAGESIVYDGNKSTVEFDVQGYQELFKKIWGFPIGVELSTNTPAAWTDMPELVVDRALWHFLEWRCTATAIMDIILTNDTRYAKELASYDSNLWAQMEEIAYTSIFAHLGVDQFGRFFAQIEPQMIPEADRDWPTVMDLTQDDYFSEINIDREVISDVSGVDFSGVAVDASGKGAPFFSLSPGHVPDNYGVVNPGDQYLLTDQDGSNQLAGLLYGWLTNPYKTISLSLLNNKMVSCIPRQFVGYTLETTDTIRELALTINLIPRRRSLRFNPDTGFKYYEFDFEAETFEQVAITGDSPEDGAGAQPLPSFPSLPTLPLVLPGDLSDTPDGPPVVVIVDNTKGILFTENFNEATPTWRFWNTGIEADEIPYIIKDAAIGTGDKSFLCQTPSGAWYLATYKPSFDTYLGNVYYAPSLGARWSKIIDYNYINDICGTTGEIDGKIVGIGCNYTKPEEIMVLMSDTFTLHVLLGNIGGFVETDTISFTNQYPYSLTFGNGLWVWGATDFHYVVRFDESGSYVDTSTDFGQGANWVKRAGTSSVLFMVHAGISPPSNQGLWYSLDNGDNWTQIGSGDALLLADQLTLAPDGITMFCILVNGADRGRSFDGGATWDGTFFTYAGFLCYAYAGGADVESRWILGRAYVRYSPDAGATWQAKEGNLAYLIPISMVIGKIVVPGYY